MAADGSPQHGHSHEAHGRADQHGHAHQHVRIRPGAAQGPDGARQIRRLWSTFVLVASFAVAQVVVGLATGSLALLSDSGHMVTDAVGLGMAAVAISLARRSSTTSRRTFGLYRLEILAALGNAVLLVGVAGWVVVEAISRLDDPPEVMSWPVLVMGAVGLAVNVVSMWLLRADVADNLNMRGAYLEVVADAIGSVGVLLAALVMGLTEWYWVDPVVGAAIGLFIAPRAIRLGIDAVRVLAQMTPGRLDLDEVRGALLAIDGVVDVHDLHAWTLTSDMEVLTAHLSVRSVDDAPPVLRAAQTMLVERFRLEHATLQTEVGSGHGCEHLAW